MIFFAWAFFLCVFGTALIYVARSEKPAPSVIREKIGKLLLEILSPICAFCSLVIICSPSKPILFHSEMGQNFWMAIVAWTTCFVLTILISLATRRTKTDQELTGLVYSLTPKPKAEDEPWYKRPVALGIVILIATIILNIIFW